MELMALAKEKTQEQELEGKDALKVDLYFWLQALVMVLVALILIFTFVGRIIGVVGSSMYPTLHDGDLLLLQSIGYTPKQGDVVVLTKEFDTSEGPIVKRVIATGGQHVVIDYDAGTVTVDGEVLDDALANFDDSRAALALECLEELGEERQILLFTCHSRERAWQEGR